MRRYIEIYSIMLRNSLIRSMSFKVNFLLWMLVEVLWFVGQIVFFSIIFANVDRIGDWTKWEVVLLVGTHQIIAQIFQAFFFVNIANIPELVRTGKLDSVLVLPIDSQFAVSSKQFELDSIVNAIVGAAIVILSLSNLHLVPSLLSVLLYLTALVFGILVHYSIMLSLAAVSFWIVRAQGLVYGYFNFLNIARYPDVIFSETVPGDLWLDHTRHYHCQHPGASVDQAVKRSGVVDDAFGDRFDDCVLAFQGILASCLAPLLQRKLVNID